ERLDELLERPAQRIGLSATIRPPEVVTTYLAGNRPVAEGGRPARVVSALRPIPPRLPALPVPPMHPSLPMLPALPVPPVPAMARTSRPIVRLFCLHPLWTSTSWCRCRI